jgi:hypothetical protein
MPFQAGEHWQRLYDVDQRARFDEEDIQGSKKGGNIRFAIG